MDALGLEDLPDFGLAHINGPMIVSW